MGNNEKIYPLAIGKTKSFYYLLFKGPWPRLSVGQREQANAAVRSAPLRAAAQRAAAASADLEDCVHAVLEHRGEVGPGVLQQDAAQGGVRRVGRVLQVPNLEHAAAGPGEERKEAGQTPVAASSHPEEAHEL